MNFFSGQPMNFLYESYFNFCIKFQVVLRSSHIYILCTSLNEIREFLITAHRSMFFWFAVDLHSIIIILMLVIILLFHERFFSQQPLYPMTCFCSATIAVLFKVSEKMFCKSSLITEFATDLKIKSLQVQTEYR